MEVIAIDKANGAKCSKEHKVALITKRVLMRVRDKVNGSYFDVFLGYYCC